MMKRLCCQIGRRCRSYSIATKQNTRSDCGEEHETCADQVGGSALHGGDSTGVLAEVVMGQEVLQYIAKRVHHLSCHVLPHREAKAKTVLTHIRSSEMILDQLSRKMT